MWGRLRRAAAKKNRPAPVHLRMESLEDRVVPAPFTPGNLVIYRVGDGTGLLANGSAVFLDEYSPSGSLVQSIALPTTASGSQKQLIANGNATSEGLLSVSANGQYLLLTGYGRDLGSSTPLTGTTSASVPRVVGRAAANGSVDTSTALTDFADITNPRSATSTNGTDIWVTGAAGGIRYTTFGSTTSTQISTTLTNLRQTNIFADQLYVSTGSGSAVRVGTVGTGTPTTSGQVITNLPGFPTAGSPYGFFLADLDTGVAGVDTLYVASDDAGALTKYSLVSGNWTANGTVGVDADDYRGLTATVSGTTVTLYATRKGGSAAAGGEFVTLTDASGYNGALSGTPTLLATAAANTSFRGISFTPVSANSPPVVTTSSGSTSYTENGTPVAIDANITVTDDGANLTGATIQITSGYVNGQDVLGFTNTSTITGTFNASTGTLTLSGTDTVANYQTALRTVTYTNTSDDPSTADRTVTFIANDGTNLSAGASKTVTVTAVNDAPTLTATPTNPTFTENGAAVGLFAGAAVSTIEAGQNIDRITLTVSSVLSTGSEFLFIDGTSVALTNGNSVTTATNGLTVSVTIDPPVPGGTATVTISKTGGVSPAAVVTLVNELTYTNTSDDPINVDRRVTLTSVRDTGDTAGGGQNTTALSILSTVTVVAVNDAPLNAVPGTQTTPEDTPRVFSTTNGNAISVSDPDLAEGALEVTLTATNGTVTLSTIDNLTFSVGDGTADVTMTFSGSVPSINAALNGLTFAPAPNFNGSASLRIITNDGGNTGTGGPQTDDDTITVTITSVNDAPVVTTSSGSTSYTEGGPAVVIDANVTVTDDGTNLTGATVQITSGYINGQDVLAFTNTATITGTFDAATGTLTLSGTDTVANYQAALRTVTYTNTSDNPATADRTVTFVATDGTDASAGANKTVTVTAVNDAPVVTTSSGSISYTENGSPVAVDGNVSVSDVDSANLTGATVQITSGYVNGQDVLAFTNTATITGTFDAATGTLTLSGTDTVANYQAALRTVTYTNTSDNPATADRTITFIANDGTNLSASATKTVTVRAVNDAPTLAGANNFSAINEDPASNPGTLVSALVSGQVTDPDGPFSGIAITATVTTNGSWEYTVNGTIWKPVGSVSGTSALLLAADANTRVRFVPNANFNGTVTSGLTFRAWDQSTGSAEALVDVSTNGGTTAFSSATASSSITVNSVNDDPAGANATVTTNEDVAYTLTTADFGFTDPNDSPANALAAVKIITLPAAGTLTNNGTAVTAGQFVSASDIAAGRLRFAPIADANGTDYASFTFQVQDTGGTANGGVDLDQSPNTITVNVTAVNDAPTLTDPADLTVPIAVAQTVNLTGITAGGGESQTLTVTATSDNTDVVPNPTVSYLSPSATGALSFTPTTNGSATITVRVTDDNGTPADPTDDAFFEQTFLVTVPANVPPVNTAPASVTTAEDTAFAFTGANTISVTDPDNSVGSITTVVSIPTGRGALRSSAGSGSSVTITGSAAAVNAALATLVYTPPADANNATFGGPVALTVSTTDGLGANDTDTVSVNVTAVNDPPSFTLTGNPPTVNEDAGPQSVSGFATSIVAGPATATDETGQTLTFVVTNNTNPALFGSGPAISASGTLTYTTAANANGSATITVVLMDSGSGTDTSAPQTFTVSVTAVNDAPVGTSGTVTPTEDTTYTFTTANFGFTDPGDAPPHALLAVRIASLPAIGLLTNGGPVAVGQFVSAADIAAGNLRYTPVPNGAGTGYASFTFQVQDTGDTANGGVNLDPSPNTITINVAPINDAPTLTLAAPAVLVLQNSGPYTQDNFATSSPGGGLDEATQTITYTVFNTNSSLFSVQPAVSPTGRLTFTPAPGASGTVTITVVAVDSGAGGLGGVNSSAPQSFALTVSNLNPPSRMSAPLSVGIGTQLVALGTDAGTPGRVTVIDATTGAVVRDFFPFGGFAGGVRPAIADMNGDGTEDIIVATASQFGLVAVFDGATGGLQSAYLPFGPFPSGLQVAAGDLDGDGRKDLVLGLDSGAPLVVAINGRTGAVMQVINAIPGFAGGVRLALGDVTGDNRPDIVTVAGPGGNGLVVASDGTTGAVVRAFFAYPGLSGDISLAVGDVTGDGLADIVAGIQVPGGTFVGAFAPTGQLARGYFAPTVPANPAVGPQTGRVSLADVTGDRVADLLVGSPPNTFGTALFVVNGATGAVIDQLLAFNRGAFNPLFGSGVFIRTN